MPARSDAAPALGLVPARAIDRALVGGQVATGLGLLWPGRARWQLPLPVRVLAAGALLAGGGIALAGVGVLGRHLTAMPAPTPEAPLRRHGAYARVRNPIYAGLLLGGAGLALLRRRPEPVVAYAALTAVLNLKVRREERWLRQRFGRDYDAYLAAVPRLLPAPLGRPSAP